MSRSSVTYQELSDLEAEFDDFNVELLRVQAQRETALYARRAALVRRIEGFWPLVLEHAPPEVDQYIQPTDAAILLSSLQSIDVTRFEAEKGDPRSFAVKFTFAKNEYFEDSVLEKRFWYRQQAPSADELKKIAAKNEADKAKRAKSGKKVADDEDEEVAPDNWAGLVSEPVPIKWKEGKDLTNGLLDLAVKVWADVVSGKDGKDTETENQTALKAALDKTALGGISFFAWFGYVGRRVTAEESAVATAQDKKVRAERAVKWAEKAVKFASETAMEEDVEEEEEEEEDDDDEEAEEDEDEDDGDYAYEIFQDGDTVALGLAEDVWPNAIKYFYEAQEQDTLSELDFEGEFDEEDEAPPLKKQKN